MVKVKSGIIEVKSKDPYMRSFKVPQGKLGITAINVYSNKKNTLFTVVICKKDGVVKSKKNLLESDVKEILKIHGGRK
jgi:hypothetical protein